MSIECSSTGRLFHTAGPSTVDQETPVALAYPCSWNMKLMQIGGNVYSVYTNTYEQHNIKKIKGLNVWHYASIKQQLENSKL